MLSWLSPPPLGRILILCLYQVVVGVFSFYDVHRGFGSLEDFGFRIGWIATAQMPLIFLLASRLNVIAMLMGMSYEQLNWLHQWVARTFLLFSTLHGLYFIVLWVKQDFFWAELKMMPMVGIGMIAWGVLVWIFISSILPLRRLAYEFFILQHVASAAAFLYLLMRHLKHLPLHNKQFVLWCIAIFALDATTRVCCMLYQSFKWAPRASFSGPRVGYETDIQAPCEDITMLTIKGVRFSWQPGQHILVWMPRFFFQTPHPFTIANTSGPLDDHSCQEIQLVLRSKRGLTRELNTYARQSKGGGDRVSLRAFLSPPHGQFHDWSKYSNVVLVSVSTGASFSLPIVESILAANKPVQTARISLLVIAKRAVHLHSYRSRISQAILSASDAGIVLDAHIFITTDHEEVEAKPLEEDEVELLAIGENVREHDEEESKPPEEDQMELHPGGEDREDLAVSVVDTRAPSFESSASEDDIAFMNSELGSSPSGLQESLGRPDIGSYLEAALEGTKGAMVVAVCGGSEVVADTRNAVAKISMRRFLGIYSQCPESIVLHVEEFGL